jgi:deoxyribose-phosphate aldolase
VGAELKGCDESPSRASAIFSSLITNKLMSNPGIDFNCELIENMEIRPSDLQQSLKALHVSEPSEELLCFLISCLDLTSLSATDTPDKIDALVERAKSPLPGADLIVAGVCVYQPFVAQLAAQLQGSGIAVAAVGGGFPAGQMDILVKCADIAQSVDHGANEIDAVICRSAPLRNDWQSLYDEVRAMKQACQGMKLKLIIATGDLKDELRIYQTAMTALMAGADVIKTSTGMEAVNATPEAAFWMLRAIREYRDLSGFAAGFKAAGGIKTTAQAMQYYQLLERELGSEYLHPDFFRIGASSLLDDVLGKIAALRS